MQHREQVGRLGLSAGAEALFERTDLDPAVQEVLQSLARASAVIAELESELDAVETAASTDALTGLWNRSRTKEALVSELQRFQRYGHPATLVFFDLDHFKRVNDTFGHDAGDRVLRGAAQTARQCLRTTDMLGRWGGEEFVAILPNTALAGARIVAERVRKQLEAIDHAGVGTVTGSLGVATVRRVDTVDSWLERADAAAYVAKHNGRNRVEAPPDANLDADATVAPAPFVKLVWHPSYESGHAEIDAQHRRLFELVNDLLGAVTDPSALKDRRGLVDALLAEVVAHFHFEEGVVRASGWDHAEEHARIHNRLVARAMELAEGLSTGSAEPGAVFQFLAYEVIATHMLREDRKFFAAVGGSLRG